MKKRIIIFLSLLLVGCSPQLKTITDDATASEIEKVTPENNHFLVVWSSDAMDRGDHDYNSIAHSDLVVDPNYDSLKRGDVLYYKMLESETKKNPMIPEDYLGRVVGLPGETVMIRYGHVYINNKRLDTFYGEATMTGSTEEEYFRKADLSRIEDIEWVKSYFKTDLNPIKVDEGTVFVLVDQWWRGTDSKDFGLLPIERIEGKVLGYSKK
ncbi:signal peptidase I [Psychrobacillus sp. L4]|uniref:signal peptidase I n=1 Tax=Psychrobacillus sp. L4 TaxID=3236892 RepID=UPI0036F22EFD